MANQHQETDDIIALAHASLTKTLGGATEATFWTIFLLALALSQQKERSWSQHLSAIPRTNLKYPKNIGENIALWFVIVFFFIFNFHDRFFRTNKDSDKLID